MQLGSPTMHKSGIGITNFAGESHVLDGLGVIPHHQTTHDGVLEKRESEDSEQGVGVESREVLNPSECLIRSVLSALQGTGLHVLHHCD